MFVDTLILLLIFSEMEYMRIKRTEKLPEENFD